MNGQSTMAARRLLVLACMVCAACTQQPKPGEVLDEARQVGRAAASFPHAGEDYFRDMDGGVVLTPDEIKGRNMWLVWTGGNDRLTRPTPVGAKSRVRLGKTVLELRK